jgi:iron complex outermembrane receptor protein
LFKNGFNARLGAAGAADKDTETAVQAGLGRNDRRTIVGGRWEHDFDNTTTWRNQFVFDDRNISQPTSATSAIGDFPSYNYMSDITKRGDHAWIHHICWQLLQYAGASSDFCTSCQAAMPR